MSYCVNCGVKLESNLERCPLCNTPVLNPNEIGIQKPIPPFPQEKGHVEPVKNKDVIILYTLVLAALAVSCGLLNAFVFTSTAWSIYIVGSCILLWVLAIPVFLYTRLPVYFSLLFDGLATALFAWMITFDTGSDQWFYELALPTIAIGTLLAVAVAFLRKHVSSSILPTALYVTTCFVILCLAVELLYHWYQERVPFLTWSAVVLTAGAIIDVAIITMLSRKRLRNAVRRRLHF